MVKEIKSNQVKSPEISKLPKTEETNKARILPLEARAEKPDSYVKANTSNTVRILKDLGGTYYDSGKMRDLFEDLKNSISSTDLPLIDKFLKDKANSDVSRRFLIDNLSDLVDGSNRKYFISILAGVVEDSDEQIRDSGIRVLGKIGVNSKEAASVLIKVLQKDTSEFRRSDAANQLGEIGIKDKEVVSALIKAFKKGEGYEKSSAARSLSKLNVQEAIPVFIEALSKNNDSTLVAYCLGNFNTKEVKEALIKALRNTKDSDLIAQIASSLGKIGAKGAIPDLVKALNNKFSNYDKVQMIESLGALGAREAIPDLINILDNTKEDTYTRRKAAEVLGKIGSEKEIPKLIKFVQNDKMSNTIDTIDIRRGALKGLGNLRIKAESVVPILIKALENIKSDSDRNYKVSIIEALGNIGSEKAVDSLDKLFEDPDLGIRTETVESLRKIGTEKASRTLIKGLTDDEPSVQIKSIQALGSIKVVTKEASLALLSLLGNEDTRIRDEAYKAIIKRGPDIMPYLIEGLSEKGKAYSNVIASIGTPSLPALLSAFKDKGVIKNEKLRANLTLTLGRVGKEIKDKDEKSKTIEILRDLLKNDKYYLVRINAISALENLKLEKSELIKYLKEGLEALKTNDGKIEKGKEVKEVIENLLADLGAK